MVNRDVVTFPGDSPPVLSHVFRLFCRIPCLCLFGLGCGLIADLASIVRGGSFQGFVGILFRLQRILMISRPFPLSSSSRFTNDFLYMSPSVAISPISPLGPAHQMAKCTNGMFCMVSCTLVQCSSRSPRQLLFCGADVFT